MEKNLVKTSKFLSMVLRHKPERIGLKLDAQGWVDVAELLEKAASYGRHISPETLLRVVKENDKQRFAFNEDQTRIRANQGHSVSIDLGLSPVQPPDFLYHGTALRFLKSIKNQGLLPRKRHHVHLSPDKETAIKVGQRHGSPVILVVASGTMFEEGHAFFQSENGVWLTDKVPTSFIQFPDQG